MAVRANVREAIWAVAKGSIVWYLLCFSIQVLVGMALTAYYVSGLGSLTSTLLAIWQNSSSIVITSAATSIILIEGINLMVLANKWRKDMARKAKQAEREAYERGRQDGLQEARRQQAEQMKDQEPSVNESEGK